MEVRIKDNNGYVDADWTIEEGIMVVSPKVEKFEPKDGDVFCIDSLYPCIGIVTEVYDYGKPDKDRLYFSVGYWKQSGNMQLGTFCACNRNTEPNYRPATEEEKKLLFDKLKEKGFEWNAEKKEVVKIKWKPVLGEVYFRIEFVDHEFRYADWNWKNSTYEIKAYERGWCFKTKEECQEFCNRLNDAINSVKL